MYLSSILWLLAWPALIAVTYFTVRYFLKKADLL
jgi:hypothetical protein